MGEKGGSRKNYDIPPSNFRADISDEKERKREFLTAGCEETKLSKEYQDWLRETCDLFSASVAKRETKMGEQIQITEGSTIKLIRERSCGRNIFYKVEEKGESIHATMNDINRKCWVIKNKEARLWKIIERYELGNVTNIEKD